MTDEIIRILPGPYTRYILFEKKNVCNKFRSNEYSKRNWDERVRDTGDV